MEPVVRASEAKIKHRPRTNAVIIISHGRGGIITPGSIND